jgi:hypothetical protein
MFTTYFDNRRWWIQDPYGRHVETLAGHRYNLITRREAETLVRDLNAAHRAGQLPDYSLGEEHAE